MSGLKLPRSRSTSRLLRGLVAVLLGAAVLWTVAQQIGRFGPWWLELSRYLPYPVLLVPVLLALALAFAIGWRWVVASLATLGLVATLAMGLAWGSPDAGTTPLRLMTFNIKAYKASKQAGGLQAIVAEVEAHRPDILLAQNGQDLTAAQTRLLRPGGGAFGLPYFFAFGEYTIASRYPLEGCAPGRLYFGGRQVLPYVRCAVTVDGVALILVSVHFESPRKGLNAARHEGLEGVDNWRQNFSDRLEQSRTLADDLALAPRPLIIGGDLNAPESSPVVRRLLALGLRDAFTSAGRGYGFSYGQAMRTGFSFLRIDHLLVSPGIGVHDVTVGAGDVSDHRPVIADLLLRR